MTKKYYLIIFIIIFTLIRLNAQSDRIHFNDQDLFISGMNLAWLDYANDLTQLDIDQFSSALDELKAARGNCFRWWLHVNGVYSPQFTNDSVSGISQASVDNLRTALNIAQEKGVGLVLCLWSFGMLNTGDGSLTAAQTSKNLLMLEDTIYTKAYINNALIPMVDSVKGHPAIVCWEIFNEPEGMASDAHPWAGWTPQQVEFNYIQRFMNLTTAAIHRTDPEVLVSSGAWNVAVNTDVDLPNIGSSGNLYSDDELVAAGGDTLGKLDFYMIHFYPDHGSESSPFHHPASYWELDKPIVVGEFRADDPYPGIDSEEGYQYLYDNGYAGALAWTWTGHDGNGNLADATPGMEYLWNNYQSDVEVLIDSASIDFTPYIVTAIKDTFMVVPEDTVTVSYVDLKTIFEDVEDSVLLAFNIHDITDTSLVKVEINAYDSVIFKVMPNTLGLCSVTIRATDSAGKFVDASFTISVYDSTTEDVAVFRKITVSSIENSSYLAAYAIDADETTRWSTEYTDDEYMIVEFEKTREVQRIFMDWEAAYGEVFHILTSVDGVNWDTAFSELYGNGDEDLIIIEPANARMIMMDGILRGTQWGYSLYSFEVYETPGTNTAPTLLSTADTFTVQAGTQFELEASIFFVDATVGDQLTYSATLDGSELNSWLSLNLPGSQDDAEFSGIPLTEDVGNHTVEITATDRYGESVSRTFVITVFQFTEAVTARSLNDIKIYPNPVNKSFYIQPADNRISKIELFDIQGRLIKTIQTENTGKVIEIDVNYLKQGVYYLKIHADQGTRTDKLIKN